MKPDIQEVKGIGYRCLIKGRFTTKSFLHIGNGELDPETAVPDPHEADAHDEAEEGVDREEQGTPSKVDTVVIGHDGKAIIPASAIRGALRSRLMRLDPVLARSLMGTATEPGSTKEEDKGKARRLFVQTATIVEPCADGPVFDRPSKCVDRIAMTAMSRWRRAPQNKMLRTVEAVPPEVIFTVSIGICGDPDNGEQVTAKQVTADDVSAVLWALGKFDSDKMRAAKEEKETAADPDLQLLQLGAFQKEGWGLVEWKTCQILALTRDGLKRWLNETPEGGHGEQGWGICTEPVEITQFKPPAQASATNESIRLALTLKCQSTFFTADQRLHTQRAVALAAKAAKERGEESPEKLAKVMRVDGRAWLSGQSLKGALRSQFERILRTRGIACCDPSLKELDEAASQNGLTMKRCDPIRSVRDLGDRCPACQVFGMGGWASTIKVSPFQETAECSYARREFIAISRFTGGGVPHLKFSADVAMQPKLSGEISINIERLNRTRYRSANETPGNEIPLLEPILGALLHLFRDFAEGDIPVGAGRSKGFGAFTVSSPSVSSTADGLETQFAQAVLALLKESDKVKPARECIPATLQPAVDQWLGEFETWVGAYRKEHPEVVVPEVIMPQWWNSPTTQPQAVGNAVPFTQKPPIPGSFNPYHWVPAATPPKIRPFLTAVSEFEKTPAHRHDVYAADGISGEMTVQITSITPIFVGGQRVSEPCAGHPAEVDPYEVDKKPAIPSTSLRGLLSSTYEIATASAMRVLDTDRIYSYRMAASSRFHLIGRITNNGTKVEPWNQRPAGHQYTIGDGVPTQFKNLDPWNEVPQNNPRGDGQEVPNYYCLDYGSRHEHMPIGHNGRSHEIRLNVPRNAQTAIPITDKALEQFYRLADDRTDETKDDDHPLPYEPKGQRKNGRRGNDLRYRLKDRDFVYFEAKLGKDGEPEVVRLSLSQIWRDDVKKSVRELLVDPDLVPFRPGRMNLTLAETAFGFVRMLNEQEKRQKAGKDDPLPAFASKIVLSDALLTGTEPRYLTEQRETLKILSSPKPPSPAFYFGPVGSNSTSPGHCSTYEEIAQDSSKPRGRKMYLHLDRGAAASKPWKSIPPQNDAERVKKYSELQKQRVSVRCLAKDNQFEFTIKFDSLTEDEFLALCYTLQPCSGFHHKLGMAKPLGLGSIAMEVRKLQIVNRIGRYRLQGFRNQRFTETPLTPGDWISQRAKQWRDKVTTASSGSSTSFDALEIIATTLVPAMQYPMTKRQTDKEFELFDWPSLNRKVATKKDGRDWAHFLLPVRSGSNQPGEPIMPLPWPCEVIVIARQGVQLAPEVGNLNAKRFDDATAVGEYLSRAPLNTMYYVVGSNERIEYHKHYVRRINVASIQNITRLEADQIRHLVDSLSLSAK